MVGNIPGGALPKLLSSGSVILRRTEVSDMQQLPTPFLFSFQVYPCRFFTLRACAHAGQLPRAPEGVKGEVQSAGKRVAAVADIG